MQQAARADKGTGAACDRVDALALQEVAVGVEARPVQENGVHLTSIVATPAAAAPIEVDAAVENLVAGLGVQGRCLVQGLRLAVVQPCSNEVSSDDVVGGAINRDELAANVARLPLYNPERKMA